MCRWRATAGLIILGAVVAVATAFTQSTSPQNSGPESSAPASTFPGPGPVAASGTSATPSGAALLGMRIGQAYHAFGVPAHIYPIRGEKAWQDDVVFFYPTHLYLYWYDDRVWQIRFDERFEGSFLNIAMGASREEAQRVLGKPLAAQDDWVIWQLPDRGFPVRARLFFRDDRLCDAYIYRSDF